MIPFYKFNIVNGKNSETGGTIERGSCYSVRDEDPFVEGGVSGRLCVLAQATKYKVVYIEKL